MILDVSRSAALHQPLEQHWIEFLLDSVVQGCLAFAVLVVHVGALERKEFGRFESLPAPAGQERRASLRNNIDWRPRTDQDVEEFRVIPPAGSKQAGRGGTAFDE